MRIKGIKRSLSELQALVGGWREGEEPAAVELDIAMEQVKRLYEMLRFPTDDEVEEPVEVDEPVVEAVIIDEVVEEEQIVEEVIEDVAEEEEDEEVVVVEEQPAPIVEQQPIDEKSERRRKILSLYNNIDEATLAAINEPEPEPISAPEVVESPHPVYSAKSIESQLGFNDRLLLASDLFDGSMSDLNAFIKVMDEQPSLDDAILYIAENYSWDGDVEGAKLLYVLLENRF